ncbi:MAG: aspartyl/glutamyl-tRNA amidotransferase subunit C [Candidatus Ancillula sp.]|jgi:aspartyl-tRNA(Asn)/glutamyl-tRNA(Gln) amidotransferase subunit C|nr:aspartyl/glutamyl-tRNA amidotransferase subunit C [Candidatus Ancillula sp.]
MSSKFTVEEVMHLGSLARIALSEDDAKRLSKDLSVIDEAIKVVQEVATSDVTATSHPLPLNNVMRDDTPAQTAKINDDGSIDLNEGTPFSRDLLTVEEAISSAPQAEANQFVAPQILGEE